jgi:hypothetical protein
MYPVSSPYYDADGYIGMPLCWTHNVDMDYYGTSGDYVYLGFTGTSPQFDSLMPSAYGEWYWFHLAYFFFDIATQHNSIIATLNYLSWEIYGTSFTGTPLYNYLIIWGNQNMYLY